MTDALAAVLARRDLSEEEAYAAMDAVFAGDVPPARLAAFLVALRMKGESASEIVGFARAMRDRCARIRPNVRGRLTDTCGTGGAAVKTFNVSTAAAFLAAGAGVPVAKHGNRSVTSPCGSADVLEALGANLDLEPDAVNRVLESVGFAFLFAPRFHPAMRFAAPVRKELGVRTVFNLLGPLTNPAGAAAQVLGVFDANLVDLYADVLARLGVEKAMVVHGTAGMDEVSTVGPTLVAEVSDGRVRRYALHPRDFGLREATADAVAGLPPPEAARLTLDLLAGGGRDAARRDMALLNAACALYVGGRADTVRDGLRAARESMDGGAALRALRAYVRATGGTPPGEGGPVPAAKAGARPPTGK